MTETLLLITMALLLNAAFIVGLHGVTRDGNLLGFVERWWRRENPNYQPWRDEVANCEANLLSAMKEAEEVAETHAKHEAKWAFEKANEQLRQAEIALKSMHVDPEPRETIPAIANPLTECPFCMPTVWGTIGLGALIFAASLPWFWIATAPAYCIALAGVIYGSRSAWGGEE